MVRGPIGRKLTFPAKMKSVPEPAGMADAIDAGTGKLPSSCTLHAATVVDVAWSLKTMIATFPPAAVHVIGAAPVAGSVVDAGSVSAVAGILTAPMIVCAATSAPSKSPENDRPSREALLWLSHRSPSVLRRNWIRLVTPEDRPRRPAVTRPDQI